MKDEIKEILLFKENADYKRLSIDEILVIIDNITTLQEEIERLQKKLDFMIDRNNEKQEVIDKVSDMLVCAYGGDEDYYMKRIKKAQKLLKGE